MASTDTDILNDLVQALRSSGAFALVELTGRETSTAVPRATVLLESRETFPSEPWPTSRWVRLQTRVLIRTRGESAQQGTARLTDLLAEASSAVLADPYRGGRCCDLPIGRATEIHKAQRPRDNRYPERQTSLDVRWPEQEACLTVRCHYEQADAGTYPTAARLDGEDLFSSGPCKFEVGPWDRETLRRGVPGVSGEWILDLGRRGRTITQRGQLQADTTEALLGQLSAIEAKDDAQLHSLADHDGRSFAKVVLERVQPSDPVFTGRNVRLEYSITYRQLP